MSALDLEQAARERGPGTALVAPDGRALSWEALATRVAAARAALEARAAAAGLGPEDLVAIVARPGVDTFVALHAAIAARRPVLPIHPRLTAAEVHALLDAVGPVHRLEEGWADRPAAPTRARPAPPDEDRVLAVLASSGTTGTPKGIELSRRAFVAAAVASAAGIPFGPGDRWLACMPLAHAGGLSIVTRALVARATVVLHERFDPDHVLSVLAERGASHLSVVPTMLRALLEHPRASALSHLEALLVGGAACPDALLAEARALGAPAVATYGLSEACSQVATQPLSDVTRAPAGDAGLPLPGVEVSIRGGEILVRSRAQMRGYRGAPRLEPGAWLSTGDLGELRPDGRLVVEGRRADLVVTGGENAYPAEIERALRAVAGIEQAVVFGVDDDRWGQVVAAVLVLAPGSTLEVVTEEAARSLAPHKRPRLALVVPGPLPATSKGEPDRRRARERWASEVRPLRTRR